MSERQPHIVVMGVTGCGKTTIARQVADIASARFLDADDLHPASNVEKMAAGIPLTDEDRAPWLDAVRDWIGSWEGAGGRCVVACSALRRTYRDVLRGGREPVVFVQLDGAPDTIRLRIAARRGHFMRPVLLESQLALLEPLEADELGVVLDAGSAPAEIARRAAEFLKMDREVVR